MKRLAIFLRNSGGTNKFRRTVLSTLRSAAVDEALLCSGFFQEGAKYSAGADFDIMAHRPCKPLKLTTLGLYSYSWKAQYNTFFSNLKAKNMCGCFTAAQKRIPSMGWHAKVFLAKAAKQPVVAIIGSSNITSRAFGAFKDFNRECDVVMWEECNPTINDLVEAAIGDSGVVSDVIVTNYDDKHRANKTSLRERLLAIEEEIMSIALDV